MHNNSLLAHANGAVYAIKTYRHKGELVITAACGYRNQYVQHAVAADALAELRSSVEFYASH